MNHLKAINQKAHRVVDHVSQEEQLSACSSQLTAESRELRAEKDVVALQQGPPQQPPQPHFPLGCSLVFSPGWEADSTGGTAGLCQPVERDIFDCHIGCFWPAHVPDQLNHAPDWTAKCASAQKDWRKLDLVFPG